MIFASRQAYYTRCGVAPDDRDEVYFLSSSYSVSRNGGETHETTNFLRAGDAPGWDHHDIWSDPLNADRIAVAHDGGFSISENRGRSWFRVQLPIAQMYHVTADNAVPYNVLGNRQDGPSFRGPSNSRMGGLFSNGRIPRGEWRGVGGGESGFATPDPRDPNIVWSSASGAGAAGGIVVRHDVARGQFRDVEVWPMSTLGWPAEDMRFRFQWTFPLLLSPHDPGTIYVTSQHVHRTRNNGQSWEVISPDLSTNDKSRQTISGGLTPDNIGVEFCCVIYAFDESPVEAGVLWAGTNDGLVQVSRDDGGQLGQRDRKHPRSAPRRRGAQHRRLALGRGPRLHHHRAPPGGRLRGARLPHRRLRRELDPDHGRSRQRSRRLYALSAGGRGAPGAALPGNRELALRQL